MLPIVTPAEMRAIDAAAPEPVEQLIARAGFATARAARRLLGGAYGRRVVVLAGPGNNGADGRAAATLLARAGARCRVLDPAAGVGIVGPEVDLVIDAAYGTGFRGSFEPPDVGRCPVLAVDIPSGIDGSTGRLGGRALVATATVTFASLKPGLLLGEGPSHAGTIEVVDIGLDVSRASMWRLDRQDLVTHWPRRGRDAHKWRSACWVIGGSPGMAGAPQLAARGAQRAGAGYVRLSVPGAAAGGVAGPIEAVGVDLPATGWADAVLADADRVASFVVGPGLGGGPGAADGPGGAGSSAGPGAAGGPGRAGSGGGVDAEVRALLGRLARPVVLDGDGLRAVAGHLDLLGRRPAPTVLTPHDGEFARLTGDAPGTDRVAAARSLADRTGAVVLLKGPTTVVAEPGGRALLSMAGDARLATAGTGDVLAGAIGALLAQGVDPWLAAGLGAEAHGAAARRGPAIGLVASDVAERLADVLDDVAAGHGGPGGPPPRVEVGVPVR